MRKRVLFSIGDMGGGGSQRQLLGLLRHLDREEFAPELYLVYPQGELLAEVPEDVPIHSFAQRHPKPVSRFPGAGFFARVRDYAKVLAERQIDVSYDRTYHMTLIAAGGCRLRRTPRVSVIVTNPRTDFELNPERFQWIKTRLAKRAYHSADRVLAVSEGARQASIDYFGLPPEKIETVYNGFDIERLMQQASLGLPDGISRDDRRFLIVASGRLHFQKGFDVLIEAARLLKEHHHITQFEVWILGTGDIEQELRQQIQQGQLENHVRLLGYQPNPMPFYAAADLFCLTSRQEGMPNVLVEAMICGTPVIASDCPSGPREILQSGQWGELVPVDDPTALAEAIKATIQHQDQQKARAQPAREHILNMFSLETNLAETVRVLNEVMRDSR